MQVIIAYKSEFKGNWVQSAWVVIGWVNQDSEIVEKKICSIWIRYEITAQFYRVQLKCIEKGK